MQLEERLKKLEDAHNALAARCEGLYQVCKVIMPLIPAEPAIVRRLLTSVYDITAEHMDKHGLDAAYQADVLRSIDEISSVISVTADMRAARPKRL